MENESVANEMKIMAFEMEKNAVQAMVNRIVVCFDVYENNYCKHPSLKNEAIDVLMNHLHSRRPVAEAPKEDVAVAEEVQEECKECSVEETYD